MAYSRKRCFFCWRGLLISLKPLSRYLSHSLSPLLFSEIKFSIPFPSQPARIFRLAAAKKRVRSPAVPAVTYADASVKTSTGLLRLAAPLASSASSISVMVLAVR
jgi:hypothetical protein